MSVRSNFERVSTLNCVQQWRAANSVAYAIGVSGDSDIFTITSVSCEWKIIRTCKWRTRHLPKIRGCVWRTVVVVPRWQMSFAMHRAMQFLFLYNMFWAPALISSVSGHALERWSSFPHVYHLAPLRRRKLIIDSFPELRCFESNYYV